MLLVSMVLMGVGMVWACRWLCVGKSVWCWGEVGCSFGEIRVVGPLFGVVAWSGARGIGVGRGFARELSVVGKVGCGGCMI